MSKITELISRLPELEPCAAQIEAAAAEITAMARRGGKLIMCGNGGSAADCSHIAGELLKSFMLPRPLPDSLKAALKSCGDDGTLANGLQSGIAAIALPAETSALTAFANDSDPTLAYAQLTLAYARPGDVFLGISTSGNSQNVCAAALAAKAAGITAIALTGSAPSKLQSLSDITVPTPARETFRVQEYHLAIYHAICADIEERIYGGTRLL